MVKSREKKSKVRKTKKRESFPVPPEVNPDVVFLINKMQQQLVFLEKKIDILISQSAEQPPRRTFEERRFSKPRDNFREKSFTRVTCAKCGKDCEIPFKPRDDRPVYCRDCFSKRKSDSPFKGKRDSGFGDRNQRHGKGRKPFFQKRKERV